MKPVGPRPQRSWDWRAAGNFILGGSGSGLLIAAAPHMETVPHAVFPGVALVGAGLFLVWLEIGKPLRFLNVFRHPGRSWMTREAYAAVVLFTTAGWAWWTGDVLPSVLCAAAAGAFLYCQARILAAARGIPAWREPALTPLILSTGLAEGMAIFLAWSIVVAGDPSWMAAAMVPALVFRLAFWFLYRSRIAANAPPAAVRILEDCTLRFLVLGNVLPIALLFAGMTFPPMAVFFSIVAALLAVGTGWHLKYVIVTRAAFTQGFAIPHLPARGVAGPEDIGGARPGWS